MFDGGTRCIKLTEKRQETLLKELRQVVRIRDGVLFKRMEKLVGKLRHAAIGVPAGKRLVWAHQLAHGDETRKGVLGQMPRG